MAKRYGATETFGGYTATQLRRMKKADRIEAMIEWFHAHFEDPAERTPYESAEGGYIWIWGGPHEATEEIEAEFGEVVSFELIEQAAEEIQRDGLFDWAPKPKPGDYDDELPVTEQDDAYVIGPTHNVPEPEARAEVLRRIDALENLIRPLVDERTRQLNALPSIGHNQPPLNFTIEEAVSREEWREVQTAIENLRTETAKPKPEPVAVERGQSIFVRVLHTIGKWLRDRTNAGIDHASGVIIGIAISNPQTVMKTLSSTIQAISTWMYSIRWPF